jgi:hypothetical protein
VGSDLGDREQDDKAEEEEENQESAMNHLYLLGENGVDRELLR